MLKDNTRAITLRASHEVLQLIADGFLNKQIAQRLYVSPETVESCIGNIRFKLDARNRTHAASIGLREGLIN